MIHITQSCITGETGAGKSSLLNLLLGSEVLPHSILSSTSTICQLRNSPQARAEVFTRHGKLEPILFDMESDIAEQREWLQKYVTDRTDAEYKCIDIYWPLPMLKVGIGHTCRLGLDSRQFT